MLIMTVWQTNRDCCDGEDKIDNSPHAEFAELCDYEWTGKNKLDTHNKSPAKEKLWSHLEINWRLFTKGLEITNGQER